MNLKRIEDELHECVESLKTLRDEIRVDLHLVGMDARQEWSKIEKRLPSLDRLAREAVEASEQITAKINETRESLRQKG